MCVEDVLQFLQFAFVLSLILCPDEERFYGGNFGFVCVLEMFYSFYNFGFVCVLEMFYSFYNPRFRIVINLVSR